MELSTSVEAHFRERIKQERNDRGTSQAELAKSLRERGLKIFSSTVAKIESGDRKVSISEASVLADLFGTSVDALLGRATDSGEDEVVRAVRNGRHACTRAQLDAQGWRVALTNAALALRSAAGWQPTGDAQVLLKTCVVAENIFGQADEILGAALAEAGGLAR